VSLEENFERLARDLLVEEEVLVVESEEDGTSGRREVSEVAAFDAEGAVASGIRYGEGVVVYLRRV